MGNIKVAIAGFGYGATTFHAPFIEATEGLEISTIYERTSSKAIEAYPYVKIVRNYEEILADEEIGLVVITTPNDMHYEMAKDALLSGKNVIVEKPFTITSKEAAELIELSIEKEKLLSVYQNRRFQGDFKTIQKIVNEGLLGEVVEYEARFDRFSNIIRKKPWKENAGIGNDILYDIGSHLIDQCLTLFGMPKEIYCDLSCQRDSSQVNDYFEIILYYNNMKAILKAGMLVKDHTLRFIVNGKNGSFIKHGHSDHDYEAKISFDDPAYGTEPPSLYGQINTTVNGIHLIGNVETEKGSYLEYYENISNCLLHNAKLKVKPQQALNTIKIIEYANESNNTKKRISIEV